MAFRLTCRMCEKTWRAEDLATAFCPTCPGYDVEEIQPLHFGIHAARLPTNPWERHFAKSWADENRRSNILAKLIRPREESEIERPKMPTEREAQVVATFVQWLGTNVGSVWLDETIKTRPVKRWPGAKE